MAEREGVLGVGIYPGPGSQGPGRPSVREGDGLGAQASKVSRMQISSALGHPRAADGSRQLQANADQYASVTRDP